MPETLPLVRNNLIWFFLKPFNTAYRFLVHPTSRAVKVLVENNGRFLLVRPAYGHRQWSIPGGRMHPDESFEDAAIREVKEETGITIHNPMPLGMYTSNVNYGTVTVYTYYAKTTDEIAKPDGREIKEAMWAHPDQLPENRIDRVDKILALLKQHQEG